jgi:cell division protein FtsI (penicillin-binding protein 3)
MANIKRDIRLRVYIAFLGMCIFGIAIIWRATALQIVSGPMLRERSSKEHTRIGTLQPERGNIYSEDGALLSSSVPVFDIYVDFASIHADTFKNHGMELAKELNKLFKDKTVNEYYTILSAQENKKTPSRYFLLKNDIRYDQYMAMRSFPIFKYGPNKGGFMADDIIKRTNPFGMLGNRMIGMYRQNSQSVGLEGSFNNVLSGQEGHRIEQKIAGGVWMPLDGSKIDPQNGKDIVTNIDVNTQDIAENALLNVLTKEEAAYGTCIVMETKTGKVKAMVNLGRQADGSYWEDYNYALTPIEPGSTFKINALMSAIDDGFVTIADKINASGGVAYFANQKMSDSHLGLGTISVEEAFSHSSNVACAKLIYNNYSKNPEAYLAHLQKMQIDKPTGIDIAGERKPRFSNAEDMFSNPASLAWLAIGYEVMVTPLRTCMVYNTIANNGVMMKPYIVKEVREFGKTVQTFEPTVVTEDVCKKETIEQLKQAAFAVVESGTGKALKNDVYTICGKTGTAQVADKGITYKDRVYHGSFVGFFPKENPLYTICVVIRTKKGANNYYGGQIALPVFKEVADRLYANSTAQHTALQKSEKVEPINKNYKGMSTNSMQLLQAYLQCFPTINSSNAYMSQTTDSNGNIVLSPLAIQKNIVPNVIGMGLRDALQLLENQELRVMPSGKGKIISQSIAAGSTILKGQIINITLE